jgi:hypothetical protein
MKQPADVTAEEMAFDFRVSVGEDDDVGFLGCNAVWTCSVHTKVSEKYSLFRDER